MKHLQRDLELLKKELLTIGSMVEEAVNKAVLALVERRSDLAEEVIKGDHDIDQKELLVEEDCLKILALHQPVAVDLRFIIVALKVNNDLERMGDLAANIARRASYLSTYPPLAVAQTLKPMADGVLVMVRECLDALTNVDAELSRKVLKRDDEIDAENRKMYFELQKVMKEDSDSIEAAMLLLIASRNLERIADLATNISQDVVYMVEGELIRHQKE
jgi:phosphate transport system protein